MLLKIVFPILFSIVFFSCSHTDKKTEKNTAETTDSLATKELFEKGKTIEVVCKNDASQSYAMYLPSSYSLNKTYPLIVAFDPQGKGAVPVNLYKELAEKYGYIIVGSNNSKNGIAWEETQIIANKLFNYLGTRLAVDMQRIYLLGFSGGARIANAITLSNGGITGVICCGAASAGTNNFSPRSNYSFLGVIGNEDFNYVEMRKYDKVELAGHNVKHSLITFNGKHEWPNKTIFNDAFLWLELNQMRKNSTKKNDPLIAKNLANTITQIETLLKKNEEFEAYQLCCKTITFYDGLGDLSYFFSTYKSFQSNKNIDIALRNEEAAWTKEDKLKTDYAKAFQTEKYTWWEKEITTLTKKINTEKNSEHVLIYKRVLNYLSLVAYMQTNGTLQQNDINSAEHYCKLYILVDPSNNEAYYLMANIRSKQGNTKEAISSLNKAIDNHFTDIIRLQNDPLFQSIKNSKEFEEIIMRIK
jgi:dienelactone hydrolase